MLLLLPLLLPLLLLIRHPPGKDGLGMLLLLLLLP